MVENTFLGEWQVVRGMEAVRGVLTALDGGVGSKPLGYIAGSYAAHMTDGGHMVQPGDIDIFAVGETTAAAVARDLAERFGDGLGPETTNGRVWHITRPNRDLLPIQVIAPDPAWKDFPRDIVNNFDLNVCRAVLVHSPERDYTRCDCFDYEGKPMFETAVHEDEKTYVLGDRDLGKSIGKILRVNDPLRTFRRVAKYQARGITFSDHELLKLFRAWDGIAKNSQIDRIVRAVQAENAESTAPVDHGLMPDSGDFIDEDEDWFEGE